MSVAGEIDQIEQLITARITNDAQGMRQGDTITAKRLALLKSLRTDIQALPAGTSKDILIKLVKCLALLELEIETWSD